MTDINEQMATIRQQILDGQRAEAKRVLVDVLRAHPDHVTAWMWLAMLLDDPRRRVECSRRVLRIAPDHSQAAQALQRLSPKLGPGEKAEPEPGVTLRCPQCGGGLEGYFAGEMRDKRARCRYCDTDIDLPDSFRREQRTHQDEPRVGSRRSVDTLTVEYRSDGPTPPLTPEEIARLMHSPSQSEAAGETSRGASPEDELRQLFDAHGLPISDEKLTDVAARYAFTEWESSGTVTRRIERRGFSGRAFEGEDDLAARPGCLSIVMRLLGELHIPIERSRPAPPDEVEDDLVIGR
jgi:hypothetical protein